jgi:hypothetical protein
MAGARRDPPASLAPGSARRAWLRRRLLPAAACCLSWSVYRPRCAGGSAPAGVCCPVFEGVPAAKKVTLPSFYIVGAGLPRRGRCKPDAPESPGHRSCDRLWRRRGARVHCRSLRHGPRGARGEGAQGSRVARPCARKPARPSLVGAAWLSQGRAGRRTRPCGRAAAGRAARVTERAWGRQSPCEGCGAQPGKPGMPAGSQSSTQLLAASEPAAAHRRRRRRPGPAAAATRGVPARRRPAARAGRLRAELFGPDGRRGGVSSARRCAGRAPCSPTPPRRCWCLMLTSGEWGAVAADRASDSAAFTEVGLLSGHAAPEPRQQWHPARRVVAHCAGTSRLFVSAQADQVSGACRAHSWGGGGRRRRQRWGPHLPVPNPRTSGPAP